MESKNHNRPLITSREVADLAGVSQATVSRVVRQSANVSPLMRESVLRVLAETGYRPNAAARSMRTGRVGALGLVLPSFAETDPRLVDSLQMEAALRGFRLLLWHSPAADRKFDDKWRIADGVLEVDVDTPLDIRKQPRSIPLVAIGGLVDRPDCDVVRGDEADLGRRIAGYFAGVGKMHVGIAGPAADLRPGGLRVSAFRRGAALHDLRLPQTSVIVCEAGRAGAAKTFSQFIKVRTKLPEAIFCTRDDTAIGLMEAAREVGIRIPDDLWVIGVGDTPVAATRGYDLTSVALPVPELASDALDLMTHRIKEPGRQIERRQIRFQICVRSSTGRAPMD